MLKSLSSQLKTSYRTGRDDLVEGFYTPCLQQSILYRRAAGYFTSSGLALAARGVASLVKNGGRMRLVASPVLEEADIEALRAGSEDRESILRRVVARNLGEIEDLIVRDRLAALSWLVANGSLEVRLAIRRSEDGGLAAGIYHEKMGIFSDQNGDHVAFSGSANETASGLVTNFESIDVFCSWDDPQQRVPAKISDFNELWENTAPGVEVIEFTAVSQDLLRRYAPPPNTSVADERPRPRGPLNLRKNPRNYQQEAIQAWIEAGCKGILAMATGAGKTLTSLHALNRVAEQGPLVAVIACPYINLAEQWVRELKESGIDHPIRAYGSTAQWRSQLEAAMTAMQFGHRKFLPIVVVNRTFLSKTFQSLLCPDAIPHLLIADEMHNLGATQLREHLQPSIRYRLGLSATPERHLDEEGTQVLFDYFGNVVYEYDLARAIREETLCTYDYHPVLVELTEEEAAEYEELSKQIGRLMAKKSYAEPMSTQLQFLLLKRARLLAAAEGKLPALMRVISDLNRADRKIEKALVYCGDGKVEDTNEDDALIRQVDAAVRLLGLEAGLRVARFSAQESKEERESILNGLKREHLDAVVAIRCLDEGIDLPDVRMGFILASSTNPRQFIQRRGRLLRRSPGKDRAEIWDFIVSPPDLKGLVEDSVFNIERKLVARELIRVQEFCQTARNRDHANAALLDLRIRYNLLADI
jgi:DNA phosphorothioation system restriction enzyme